MRGAGIGLGVSLVERDEARRAALVGTGFGLVVVGVEELPVGLGRRGVVSVRAGGVRGGPHPPPRWHGWEVGALTDWEREGRMISLTPALGVREARFGRAAMPLRGLAPRMTFVLRCAHQLGCEVVLGGQAAELSRVRAAHAGWCAARARRALTAGRGDAAALRDGVLYAEVWEALCGDPVVGEGDGRALALELLGGWRGSGSELVESVRAALGVGLGPGAEDGAAFPIQQQRGG